LLLGGARTASSSPTWLLSTHNHGGTKMNTGNRTMLGTALIALGTTTLVGCHSIRTKRVPSLHNCVEQSASLHSRHRRYRHRQRTRSGGSQLSGALLDPLRRERDARRSHPTVPERQVQLDHPLARWTGESKETYLGDYVHVQGIHAINRCAAAIPCHLVPCRSFRNGCSSRTGQCV
jgi:hypothetical protein